ncbi:EmrB/QacA subfamily drug resistance transporter [Pseudomonas sp. SORGH_AS 211]|uniref:DHA2 family efflux MFS transporter permease subunit n=1 Tax=Pseudomonas sp. SORGH_AS_0211 TaxID=3041796 RepID=UPI00285F3616|nr:DHA2 family efflux MFS transporter permease subunit [Pseudomonas sp. SORGH_AS_0211]MDR6178267.1 EmrB/QacA subfamily drug resistance transporter [Pseudomonas sp. SORGH_AS_0211]
MSVAIPRVWVAVNVLLGTVTVSLANTALNPALPAFIAAFDLGPLLASWIVAGFMVAMGITMPLTGFLAERLGRRRLYRLGLLAFIAGSALGALADSIAGVLLARMVQGVASGLMIPLALGIIFSVYPREERGRVTGWWGGAVMLAPAVGPLCGSLLLEVFDWRALFLLNVPVGLLALAMGQVVLPADGPREHRPFDLAGYLLIASGLGLLLVTLGRLRELTALGEPLNLLALAAGFLCLQAFVRLQLRRSHPLLPLRLFALRGYRASVIIAVVQAVGMFECLVLLPLLIQLVLGHSALWTGLALLCTALAAALFGQVGGRLLDRRGPRGVIATGLALSGLATLALGVVGSHAGLAWICALMVLRGIGLGLSYMPATTAGLNTLPDAQVTQGAAMNNIARRLVSSVAVVAASLWLELRLGGAAGWGPRQAATGVAIQDAFIATGLFILLALPWAWRFPAAQSLSVRRYS